MTDQIRYLPAERGITRVALMRGDEELSRTLVVPMVLQLGAATVRMDGIGGVATPEQHRNQGYSRRVLEAAVDFMRSGDAPLATLYGIPHYYPKFGFATLGPEWTVQPRRLDERHALPEGVATRPGAPGDLAAIQRLYREETALQYGAVVRDDEWWAWGEIEKALQPGTGEARVVERGNAVVGYALRASNCWWMQHLERDTPPSLKIGEAFAEDATTADAVLAMCRVWAIELEQPTLTLAIPPTGRVGQAAQLQNCRIEALYGDEQEFMGRVTGLVSLLRAMAPELAARWRQVSAATPPFAITIGADGERATVVGDENGIDVSADRPGDLAVELAPGDVARLVFGGFETDLALDRAGVPAPAWAVMRVLFPKRVPYIYPLDRF
jgi:hypothetical protein